MFLVLERETAWWNTIMAFTSVGVAMKLLPRNGPHFFRCTAKFTFWSHNYIHMKQISHDMEFIILILLTQQQNSLKTNQTNGVWPSNAMIGRDAVTS
jgi:hypothetical protein